MDGHVLPLQSWNKMNTIPYKARDIHRDQCKNFSFFKDAPILIRQISIPFQLTNFTDRELKKFEHFIQEVSLMNTKKHPFYSNIDPGQRNGLDKTFIWRSSFDLIWPHMTFLAQSRVLFFKAWSKYFPSKTFSTWSQRCLAFIFLLGCHFLDFHCQSWFEIGFSHGERISPDTGDRIRTSCLVSNIRADCIFRVLCGHWPSFKSHQHGLHWNSV